MNLQFFLNEKLVETVPIDHSCISNPLYLPGLKAELQKKYKDLIEASNCVPTFYVEALPVKDRRGFVFDPQRK